MPVTNLTRRIAHRPASEFSANPLPRIPAGAPLVAQRERLQPLRYAAAAGSLAAYLMLGACSSGTPAPGPSAGTGPSGSGGVSTSSTSSTSSSVGSGAPATAAAPTLHGYTFPAGMVAGRAGGGEMFSRIEGVLALPATPGPHPLVVIVHGSYPGCIDAPQDKLLPGVATIAWPEACGTLRRSQDAGLTMGPEYVRATASFGYLARELAARGFVVAAIDVHAKEEFDWGGEPDAVQMQNALVALHVGLIKRMAGGESLGLPWAGELKGVVDFDRVALVGHSSGAGYALAADLAGSVPGLRAVVALQPVINTPPVGSAKLKPALVVAGQCDEQVGPDTPIQEAKELAAKQPDAVVLTAVVARAGHIGVVAGGGSDQIGLVRPLTTGDCATRLSPAPTQGAVTQLTADFLTTAFAGGAAYRLGAATEAPVTVASLTGAATVVTAPVATLPATLSPKTISYDSSTTQVVPPKPADLVLTKTRN